LFSPGAGDAGGSNHVAVIVFFSEIPLQGVTCIRGLITKQEYAVWKVFSKSFKLTRQTL
jgi:hypothetical protein